MKDKGFTLVELLVVIVLIGVVSGIAVTGIISNQKRLQEDLFCDKVEFIEQGAILWGQDNESVVAAGTAGTISGESIVYVDVLVSELLDSNYLKSDEDEVDSLLDPRDDSSLTDEKVRVYLKYERIYADYIFGSSDATLCDK